MVVISYDVGHVISVSNTFIKIKNRAGKIALYTLFKYNRSNQDTCVNQRPLVWTGESIEYGQIIADGPGTESGEIALGQNLLVAYMTWEGYNYEDAILINQRLVYADLFTSIHIEKYDVDVLETLEGTEEITNDIPNVENHLTKNLDENGIIYRGTFVHSGEILVGKVTPSDSLARSHQRIIQVILQKKVSFEIDTSLRVPHRSYGRVIDVRILSHENDDELPISTNMRISVFLAQIKKIKIGDKMSGRHGNKGIISRILRREDMPYLPNGTSIDLILNPLGVPSRMNVGQLFEGLFGFAGDIMDKRYKVMPFDEMYGIDASRILINNSLNKAKKISNFFWVYSNDSPGKICLKDGRTGQLFDNPITICKSYMLKLIHLVDDKIHARSVGPYSLITQQPLKGRSNQGGQRFGEMEVWALEAFGAAHTLQEILTYKSDDIDGRDRVAEAILNGGEIPEPGIPESFKVLILELKAIGLDITINKIEKKINGDIDNLEINILQESKLLPTYKSLETT
jgi:DNA-directed RNA polymerase subunit beta